MTFQREEPDEARLIALHARNYKMFPNSVGHLGISSDLSA